MDAPPCSPASAPAWPRSAQLTAAFLSGCVLTLLGLHVFGSTRWAARPTDLHPAVATWYQGEGTRADRTELLRAPSVGPTQPRQILREAREAGSRTPGNPPPLLLVDLNRASVDELDLLPGVGPAIAQRIVNERSKTPFRTVDDLRRVPGIGPKTLEKIRPHATVTGRSVAKSAAGDAGDDDS
jgi:competence ComEA-like helix-hairpin-helix protein